MKIREKLRLSEIENMNNNSISGCVGCSHNTVKELLKKAAEAGINYNKAALMSDDELKAAVYPNPVNGVTPFFVFCRLAKSLCHKKGITRVEATM